MLNIPKQIDYWETSADDDIETAGILIEKGKYITGYLYGSYARNENKQNSDIDVLLVSDDFDTDNDVILSTPWLPKYRHDFRIEPFAIGAKRFENDDYSPIIEIAKNEGIRIEV